MKRLKNFSSTALTRAELRNIKGGGSGESAVCDNAGRACSSHCSAGFSNGYPAFVACISSYNPWPCSPLSEWYTVCGSYN
jgi:hypothetical protein